MSYDLFTVPDAIESLIGFRGWGVINGKLYSCYRDEIEWPTDLLKAECIRPTFKIQMDEERNYFQVRLPEHPTIPYLECTCGIYALHEYPRQWEVKKEDGRRKRIPRPWPIDAITGVVKGWGRVDVGTKGFRAQYAKPIAIIARKSKKWTPIIEEVAENYNLEIITSKSARAMGIQNKEFHP